MRHGTLVLKQDSSFASFLVEHFPTRQNFVEKPVMYCYLKQITYDDIFVEELDELKIREIFFCFFVDATL